MSRDDRSQDRKSTEDGFAVMVPPPARPWEYQPWRGDTTVETVLEEVEELDGKQMYKIEFEDGRKENVSVNLLCDRLVPYWIAIIYVVPSIPFTEANFIEMVNASVQASILPIKKNCSAAL